MASRGAVEPRGHSGAIARGEVLHFVTILHRGMLPNVTKCYMNRGSCCFPYNSVVVLVADRVRTTRLTDIFHFRFFIFDFQIAALGTVDGQSGAVEPLGDVTF